MLAQIPGRRKTCMTMRYAHIWDQDLAVAAEKIGEAVLLTLDGGE